MAVNYSSAASQEAVNLHGATLQKARQRFCKHPVISLSEANCDDQVRLARAKVPDHRVKPEECCPTCNSSVQEEVMAMLTNNIIPDIAKFLCTGCGAIIQVCQSIKQKNE